MNLLVSLLPLVADGVDKVPSPEDVKAGWGAFAVFLLLAVAVAVLGWSMTRHLRKAKSNAEAGAFDPSDEPRQRAS